MTSNAAANIKAARRTNGQFGNQHRDEPEDVPLRGVKPRRQADPISKATLRDFEALSDGFDYSFGERIGTMMQTSEGPRFVLQVDEQVFAVHPDMRTVDVYSTARRFLDGYREDEHLDAPEELQGKVSRECLVESLVDGILWNTDRRQTPIYRCSCGVSHPDDLAEGPSARSVQCAACGVTGDQAR
jgi:hypothetical protein